MCKEILGLEDRGVFKFDEKSSIPPGSITLGMKFIISIKDSGTDDELYKSMVVTLVHTDRYKALFVHIAVPARIRSDRLLVCFALLLHMELWLEDTNQSYVQGKKLRGNTFVEVH